MILPMQLFLHYNATTPTTAATAMDAALASTLPAIPKDESCMGGQLGLG